MNKKRQNKKIYCIKCRANRSMKTLLSPQSLYACNTCGSVHYLHPVAKRFVMLVPKKKTEKPQDAPSGPQIIGATDGAGKPLNIKLNQNKEVTNA